MSAVRRFNISGYSSIDLSATIEIQPSDDGHWVRAGDYDALQARFEEHLEAWRVNSRTQGERIAELERENAGLREDAERYRFIKRYARRLDIAGYCLNNENMEARLDGARKLGAQ